MYQKCPKCNGEGIIEIPSFGTIMNKQETCPVCNGERIINQETGLPPTLHFAREITTKSKDIDQEILEVVNKIYFELL